MLDILNIPNQSNDIKIFYTQGTATWQTWVKPKRCSFIWMMCIGAGAGGGGGAGNFAGQGTAGGGSGGVVRALFPANVLPDILYVQPGPGGAGGVGQTTATTGASTGGARSFVSIAPSTAVMNLVCVSGTAAAGAVTTTTGGTAESVASTAAAGLLGLGFFVAVAGQAGATNSGVGPVSISPFTTVITSGGATGGAGSGTDPGGNITATVISPLVSGGAGATGGPGIGGVMSWKPFYLLGGSGGGGGTGGVVGGRGGDGAYGCGGGGGGTSSNNTGGNGGKGGDGLVIITSF